MIDLATGIIVTVAFLVALFVVPAWLTGLIPGKGSDKMAPSDFSDQPEGAAGIMPKVGTEHGAIETDHGKHAQIEH